MKNPLLPREADPVCTGLLSCWGTAGGWNVSQGKSTVKAVPVIGGCATTLLRRLPRKKVLSHSQSALLVMHVPAHGSQKTGECTEEKPWAYTSSQCKGRHRGETVSADKSPVAPSSQGLGQAGEAGQQVSIAWTGQCPHAQALMG